MLTNIQLCVLNNGFLNQFSDRHAMNPMHNNVQEESMEKCGTSCLLLKNSWHTIFLPVSIPSFTKIVVVIFLKIGLVSINPLELG